MNHTFFTLKIWSKKEEARKKGGNKKRKFCDKKWFQK